MRRLLLVVIVLLLTGAPAPFAKSGTDRADSARDLATAFALSANARAQSDIAGLYKVAGTYPTGQAYEGVVEIVAKEGGAVYLLHWVIESAEYVGIGFVSTGALIVAAGPIGPLGPMLANVASYTLQDGKPSEGLWAMPGGKKLYPENLSPLPKDHSMPAPQQQHATPDTSRQRGA